MNLTNAMPFLLPYDPQYSEHRRTERARDLARIKQHIHENRLHESPSIVPELSARKALARKESLPTPPISSKVA